MHFILAGRLGQLIGDGFRQAVRDILVDRNHGGFTLGARETAGSDEFVKLATAVSHLGRPGQPRRHVGVILRPFRRQTYGQ